MTTDSAWGKYMTRFISTKSQSNKDYKFRYDIYDTGLFTLGFKYISRFAFFIDFFQRNLDQHWSELIIYSDTLDKVIK